MPHYKVYENNIGDNIVSGDSPYGPSISGTVYDKDNNPMYVSKMAPGISSYSFISDIDSTVFDYTGVHNCMAMKAFDRDIIVTCVNVNTRTHFTRFL